MAPRTDSIAPHAEAAYFFRHGALRDAAYQLIPVSGRSRLHRLTLDILEEALGASLESTAELAEHARLAQVGAALAGTELPMRELRYLRLAALHAASKFQNEEACRLWERVAAHAGATESERCEALAEAGVTHWMLGRASEALRCLSGAIGEGKCVPRRLGFCLIERGSLHRELRD
jgi:predicted ATPase